MLSHNNGLVLSDIGIMRKGNETLVGHFRPVQLLCIATTLD